MGMSRSRAGFKLQKLSESEIAGAAGDGCRAALRPFLNLMPLRVVSSVMRRSIVSATLALLLVAGSALAQGVGRWETRAPMLSLRTAVDGPLLFGPDYSQSVLVPPGASGRVEEYDV